MKTPIVQVTWLLLRAYPWLERATRAHEFNFTITLKGQKGTKVSYTVDDKPTTGIIGEDGTLTIPNIKMADNGQFVISNIPYGVTYTISEATEG